MEHIGGYGAVEVEGIWKEGRCNGIGSLSSGIVFCMLSRTDRLREEHVELLKYDAEIAKTFRYINHSGTLYQSISL